MNLEEWKQLCRKAWGNDIDYLQIDRFSKTAEVRYTIRNCIKYTYRSHSGDKIFLFSYLNMVYSRKNIDELKDLEELDGLQSKVKQARLVEKLSKQGFIMM